MKNLKLMMMCLILLFSKTTLSQDDTFFIYQISDSKKYRVVYITNTNDILYVFSNMGLNIKTIAVENGFNEIILDLEPYPIGLYHIIVGNNRLTILKD
jgi:hypothetical protein